MSTQRAIIIVVALCACLAAALPSYAAIGAQLTTAPQQFASAEWGAAPSVTSLAFGAQGVQQIPVSVVNTGTLPLLGVTYTVSGAGFKTGMTLSLQACVGGTWNLATGVCTGGQVQTIVTTTGTSASASPTAAALLPAAIGASVTLEATLSKVPAKTTVGSVTVTVDRSQVRAATVSNA